MSYQMSKVKIKGKHLFPYTQPFEMMISFKLILLTIVMYR